ncbi:hypothetical protein MYU51_011967 [Penicillium brevicompactum]|uniref:uncharacterized protein n=1 Tax=Penicillium brevicompactum TaxID=5074 RepID=UPI0025422210|nr:uncharacterized protein N7506_002375 [Penicillium brevicompactum]KAJ5349122.1 hypothetical protein N7506_002375 [Penicillium brevicompactum]
MGDLNPTPPVATDLSGKTALVTGCNKGLGFEVARQLILLKVSRLIITTRDKPKGEAAIAALRADPEVAKLDTRQTPIRIEWFQVELDDYGSAISFVQEVRRNVPELDILILSAGMYQLEFEMAKTCHEMIMQVNCYTNCLILLNLLPLLRATSQKRNSPSRVTVVGSFTMRSTFVKSSRIPGNQSLIEYLDTRESHQRLLRYPDSKFLMHIFVQHLATVANPTEVIINTVCPGVVMTDILASGSILARALMWAQWLSMGRSVEKGGGLIIHAATALGEDSHGQFIQNGQVDSGATELVHSLGPTLATGFWHAIQDEISTVCAESADTTLEPNPAGEPR